MNQTTVETRQFEDKTVEKAIEAACEYFGCAKKDLEIEIVTRGSTGLFGLGGKKAKIKAKPITPTVKEGPKEEEAEPAKETVSGPKEQKGEQEAAVRNGVEADTARQTEAQGIDREQLERHVSIACQITNEILERSGLSGKANVVAQTAKPYINITGDDLSLIIGKEGQTLDALEYIVNLCLRRKDTGVNYRVMLEAAGYRERRRKNLVSMAERLAIKVKRSGKPIALEPMPARERRIVHVALKEFKGVRTHSSGQGSSRKVVITPLRKKRRQRKQRNNQ